MITLVVHGYQFGQSNHSVYLIDALRRADPTLLANDWFYTQTLQYHSVFGWVAAFLLKLGILEPAFLTIYLGLIAAMHTAWRSLMLAIGGDDRAYLLSAILYYISAGGIGLGTYQFLQDSAVLASNIANVAMLCGIAAYVRGRWLTAAAGLSLAGLMHANHAVVSMLLWTVFAVARNRAVLTRWFETRFMLASVVVAAGCLLNLVPAVVAKLGHPGSMPLDQFVDIYVRLRHPHHYDPSSWSWAQWLAFGFWIPPAVIAAMFLRRDRSGEDRLTRFFVVLLSIMLLQGIALVFAGWIYVSETLIQLSLFRFSIFAHLMMVMLTAVLLSRLRFVAWALPVCLAIALAVTLASPFANVAKQRIGPLVSMICLAAVPAVLPVLSRQRWPTAVLLLALCGTLWVAFDRVTGLTRPYSVVDPDYIALCRWSSDEANVPRDAIILTPPTDEDFRWTARRAIVVNWKSVPQLAGELPAWVARMSDSLGWPNLDPVPRQSYISAIQTMQLRYDELTAEQYLNAARKYGAAFFVAARDLGPEMESKRASPVFGRYRLYAASR